MKKVSIQVNDRLFNAISQYLKNMDEPSDKKSVIQFIETEVNTSIEMNYSSISDILNSK